MSTVLNFMLGVRNPLSIDRGDKSACVWFNELRLTDFDKTKGWAANANLNLKLSDFATISSSARYTSVGFGSIQQRKEPRSIHGRHSTFFFPGLSSRGRPSASPFQPF